MKDPHILFVLDRNYESYFLTRDKKKFEGAEIKTFSPLNEKLFDQDEIIIKADCSIDLIHSPVRQHKSIAGVLIIKNNKTFGRLGKKMLYQCYPDDKHLPIFLVPYLLKPGFNKELVNLYVTFEYDHWDEKHPYGKLTNTLGSVDNLSSFYEYQLYCKSLNASIQNFTRDAAKALKEKTEKEFIQFILDKYPNINNKIDQTEKIFSIDPKTSRDYDDAFDVTILSDTSYKICIYISNVTLWMDALNLWNSFSNRVSTIYLPDRRRPMLPTCLSECLCSLIENQIRFALTCELTIENNIIVGKKYYNSAIMVHKNFGYDDKELETFDPYTTLLKKLIVLKNKYKGISSIKTSHDVVGYLMILMNHFSGNEMIHHKNGIYRSAIASSCLDIPSNISKDATSFLQIWNSNGGEYVPYSSDIRHDIIKLNNYIHITSPIRRLIDLLNLIQFQINEKLINFDKTAIAFYNNWFEKLEYINETTRAIRKVQCDCVLLQKCYEDTEIYKRTHKGLIFDKIKRNDGYYQYGVYLHDIKLVSRVKMIESFDNYTELDFKLYLFINEQSFKKKIKLQLA